VTGLERMIQKISNATTQAMLGQKPVFDVESWSLEEIRRAALESKEREFNRLQSQQRRMWRQGCE